MIKQTEQIKKETRYYNHSLILIKLLLTAYLESPEKEHLYDSYYLNGISDLLLNIVKEIELSSNDDNTSLYWIKFILAGIYYYNESELIEIPKSNKLFELYIFIINHILDGECDKILPHINDL